jgi:hypothetical protein
MKKSTAITVLSALVFLIINFQAFTQGKLVSLQSFNFTDHYIGCKQEDGRMYPLNEQEDREFTTWRLVPGLADKSLVSFLSPLVDDSYFRHFNFMIKLNPRSLESLFMNDATFRQVPGLAKPNDPAFVSFESYNYPNHFIRHKNFILYIDPNDGSDLYKQDATFRIVPPNWDGKNPVSKIPKKPKPMMDAKQAANTIILVVLGAAAMALSYIITRIREKRNKSPAGK